MIVAELGCDMSRFPTAGHAASWAGLCPGNHESAGKRLSGRTRFTNRSLRQALVESARGAIRTRNSYLAAHCRRLVKRRGEKKERTHRFVRHGAGAWRDRTLEGHPAGRKRHRRRSTLVARSATVAGVRTLIVAVLVLFAKVPLVGADEAGLQPSSALEVAERVYDAGKVERGTTVGHTFLLRNRGATELKVDAKPG